jgi:hypothetical protein
LISHRVHSGAVDAFFETGQRRFLRHNVPNWV